MKITIEGTHEEIERAKSVIDFTCFFNSEFCNSNIPCEACAENQKLKIEYIVKSHKRESRLTCHLEK
ncbi:hypothetical protein Ccar_16665 [Clostridium carboxidivorans P7]|uniref:hypothetical protein n=1 Tax=Clostridium carboxidivorans TaxID=217159 RepID=UPI00064F18D5|nr:hypothetical protein [Clostridium carboxidivorans]AKN32403.1 hypothetical protein Ccar_16665 [Clostridium carboxidivorans P7]